MTALVLRNLGNLGMRSKVQERLDMVAFEPLVDDSTVAQLLMIHPKTLQRMARRGEIPAVRVGRFWRYRASLLDQWLKSRLNSSCRPCRSDSRP